MLGVVQSILRGSARSLGSCSSVSRRWISQDVRVMILGTHDPVTGHVSKDTWSSIRAGMEVVESRGNPAGSTLTMHVVFGGESSLEACTNAAQEAQTNVSPCTRHAFYKKAIALTDERLRGGLAEAYSMCLAGLHRKYAYDYMIAADTSHARNIFPRLGAMLDVEPVHGIVGVCEGGNTYMRSMYAGSILCKVQTPDDTLQILTCRSGNFPATMVDNSTIQSDCDFDSWSTEKIDDMSKDLLGGAPVHLPTQVVSPGPNQGPSASASLSHATIVVAGGRAFTSKEQFQKLESFAKSIGAAVGATRALVDAGIAPNDVQIGQTGKIIAPDLYIAFGISGAIQHIAGIKDSRCILAINSDAEAPLFDAADYGMVDNVHDILDKLLDTRIHDGDKSFM